MVIQRLANRRLTDNYEDVSDIPVNSEHRRSKTETRRDEDSEMTSDHMKEWLTLSELQAAPSQLKSKQEVSGMESKTKMLTHLGNSAICKLLEIYSHSWSSCTLLQIWWEAIMMYISQSDYRQEAHMEATHWPCRGEGRQKLTVMHKLAGTICGD